MSCVASAPAESGFPAPRAGPSGWAFLSAEFLQAIDYQHLLGGQSLLHRVLLVFRIKEISLAEGLRETSQVIVIRTPKISKYSVTVCHSKWSLGLSKINKNKTIPTKLKTKVRGVDLSCYRKANAMKISSSHSFR